MGCVHLTRDQRLIAAAVLETASVEFGMTVSKFREQQAGGARTDASSTTTAAKGVRKSYSWSDDEEVDIVASADDPA